jgi:hypothetical protein
MKPKQPTRARRRRDATGHLDPAYARDLLALSGPREGGPDVAFLGAARSDEDVAEALGEAFVEGATSGEGAEPRWFERASAPDDEPPFVPSPAGREFAPGTDASNPRGAAREPFPLAVGGGERPTALD